MKKLLILSLAALFGAAVMRAAEPSRAELVARVETCEAILLEFQNRPETAIHSSVLQNAKAIIILNQFKAGLLFGIKDGYGVIMVRKPGGRWSVPVLINAGEASFGPQIGANKIESIIVINDETIPRLLFKHRFNIGADVKAVAGPKAAQRERFSAEILKAPVLVYTKSVGLYAGATVKAGHIARNDQANFILYNTTYTMPELLYSDWVQPPQEVQPLLKIMQQIAP